MYKTKAESQELCCIVFLSLFLPLSVKVQKAQVCFAAITFIACPFWKEHSSKATMLLSANFPHLFRSFKALSLAKLTTAICCLLTYTFKPCTVNFKDPAIFHFFAHYFLSENST